MWGEDLWSRIDTELMASTFLLPFVTPRYLASEACRTEFTRFMDAAERVESPQLILPLVWILPPELKDTHSPDVIAQRLQKTRYLDVSAARRSERGSADYRTAVESVAEQLREILSRHESTPSADAAEGGDSVESPDALTVLARVEPAAAELIPALERFAQALERFGERFGEATTHLPDGASPAQAKAAMLGLSRRMSSESSELENASATLRGRGRTSSPRWAVQRSQQGAGRRRAHRRDRSRGRAHGGLGLSGARRHGAHAQQMPRLSSSLAPLARSLTSALRSVSTMRHSAHDWLDRFGSAGS